MNCWGFSIEHWDMMVLSKCVVLVTRKDIRNRGFKHETWGYPIAMVAMVDSQRVISSKDIQ